MDRLGLEPKNPKASVQKEKLKERSIPSDQLRPEFSYSKLQKALSTWKCALRCYLFSLRLRSATMRSSAVNDSFALLPPSMAHARETRPSTLPYPNVQLEQYVYPAATLCTALHFGQAL